MRVSYTKICQLSFKVLGSLGVVFRLKGFELSCAYANERSGDLVTQDIRKVTVTTTTGKLD